MLIDARTLPDGSVQRADICIVGGGPAGITLALRLARDHDLRVVLVESGGARPSHDAQALSEAESDGAPYFPINETRIRALGGSTWSYGGVCATIEPATFMLRPWVGDGWPFPPETLHPYLARALELCGTSVALQEEARERLTKRFVAAGLDPNRLEPLAVTLSRPLRFGAAYEGELEAAPNVVLLLHAAATALEHDAGRIDGVQVRWTRDRGCRVVARAYVLAGGGLENARLLMLAGLGGPTVGTTFMEHLRLITEYAVRPGDTPLARLIDGRGRDRHGSSRIGLAPSVQRAEELLNHHSFLALGFLGERHAAWLGARRLMLARTSPWNESPYLQDAGGGRMGLHMADATAVLRRPDQAVLAALGALTAHPRLRNHLKVVSNVEQVPDPSNRLELVSDTDRLGIRKFRLHWTFGEAEARTHERGMDVLFTELERLEPGLRSRRLGPPSAWPDGVMGTWHHMGTTRMHPQPDRGVVDVDSRVHGTALLYAAGSGVFPVSGSTAPTVTIVQLALRLADHLEMVLGAPAPSIDVGDRSTAA